MYELMAADVKPHMIYEMSSMAGDIVDPEDCAGWATG